MDGITQNLLLLTSYPEQLTQLHEMLGGYCHAIRNCLNSLKLGIYLLRRQRDGDRLWADVEHRYQEIEQFVEQLQTFYRASVLLPVPVSLGLILSERRSGWAAMLKARDRSLLWHPSEEEIISNLDPGQLLAALDTLAAWRARVGPEGTSVRVGWRRFGDGVWLSWEEPEVRTEPDAEDRPPSLALPLLARIAVAHGGSFRFTLEPGFQVEIELPTVVGAASAGASCPGLLEISQPSTRMSSGRH